MEAEVKQTYEVRATRAGKCWMLTVPEVPGAASRVCSLRDAEEYAREALAFVLDVDAGSFDVAVQPDLPATSL